MLKGLLPRIMGFLVIIITLALGPTIYTANSLIATMGNGTAQNITNMIGLEVVQGFGAFIIIFGLLVSGGMLTLMGKGTAGKGDFMKVIGSVVLIVVMLTIFPNVDTYMNTLIQASINAGDTLGKVGFGIIPVVVYVGVIAGAGWAQVSSVRKHRKSSGRSLV